MLTASGNQLRISFIPRWQWRDTFARYVKRNQCIFISITLQEGHRVLTTDAPADALHAPCNVKTRRVQWSLQLPVPNWQDSELRQDAAVLSEHAPVTWLIYFAWAAMAASQPKHALQDSPADVPCALYRPTWHDTRLNQRLILLPYNPPSFWDPLQTAGSYLYPQDNFKDLAGRFSRTL